jgi:hypothetical protein
MPSNFLFPPYYLGFRFSDFKLLIERRPNIKFKEIITNTKLIYATYRIADFSAQLVYRKLPHGFSYVVEAVPRSMVTPGTALMY